MLIIARRRGESFHIGDDIVIRVLDVRAGTVRFGVEAPIEIQVLREELFCRNNARLRSEDEIKEFGIKKKPIVRTALVTYARSRKVIQD